MQLQLQLPPLSYLPLANGFCFHVASFDSLWLLDAKLKNVPVPAFSLQIYSALEMLSGV